MIYYEIVVVICLIDFKFERIEVKYINLIVYFNRCYWIFFIFFNVFWG